jgi:hypothetical protein
MGQFQNAALLSGAGLTNQAQQQLFGQGLNLTDLFNQSVLGAANQNLQAQGANIGRAQALFGAPITAAQAQLGVGGGLFGLGQNVMPTAAGLANVAPTWPLSIPTTGAQPVQGQQPNLGAAVQGATYANTLANQAFSQNLQRATNLLQTGGNLFGGSGGGLFGSASSPFDFGGAAAASFPTLAGGTSSFAIPGTDVGLSGDAFSVPFSFG